MYRKERATEEETFPRRRRTPSFSSSLLDAIYRSIDESKAEEHDLSYITRTTMIKKKQSSSSGSKEDKEMRNLRRAIMIESWVEKQSIHSSVLSNSTSSSSESSSGAACSSSETESSYKQRSKQKPARTGVSAHSDKYMQFEQRNLDNHQQKPKRESAGFTKTKLKALKIYGELKKVKQPISPGGRIASFLNSIFNSGNVKKAKMCYVGAVEDVSSEHISKSACSSASTFSRSCLSKPPSSRSKHSNGTKRSVRFYPVSVILGEDSQPCGQKRVYEEDPSLMPLPNIQNFVRSSSLKSDLKNFVAKKGNGVERPAQDFVRRFCDRNEDDDDDDDDDAESYSSSDLFELDHLVGIGRYREELPVYETTNIRTNHAIANGLVL
ncbi:hypothetical protein FNV43_RR17932 [Rhamnella rubrinervis]|uniref:Protein BIG GRAIN 1-like A n=1 Tax=Rhamnella rubrinervis TaxID=2594499 RepID=A0A8K0E593_9ROSA|nr:hypothetical protein FNV43_RR17932 [Rhamnella rubrinervis]